MLRDLASKKTCKEQYEWAIKSEWREPDNKRETDLSCTSLEEAERAGKQK